jgi:uncharacterized protein (TIGR00369 family)
MSTGLADYDENTFVLSQALGGKITSMDVDAGVIRKDYVLGDAYRTLEGRVNLGIIASLIDDTVGEVVPAQTKNQMYSAVIDMTLSYIRPLFIGAVSVEARTVSIGKTIGHLEARVFDAAGKLACRATITASIRALDPEHVAILNKKDAKAN